MVRNNTLLLEIDLYENGIYWTHFVYQSKEWKNAKPYVMFKKFPVQDQDSYERYIYIQYGARKMKKDHLKNEVNYLKSVLECLI